MTELWSPEWFFCCKILNYRSQRNGTTGCTAFIISFNLTRSVKNSILSSFCCAFIFFFNVIIPDLHFYVILETKGLILWFKPIPQEYQCIFLKNKIYLSVAWYFENKNQAVFHCFPFEYIHCNKHTYFIVQVQLQNYLKFCLTKMCRQTIYWAKHRLI